MYRKRSQVSMDFLLNRVTPFVLALLATVDIRFIRKLMFNFVNIKYGYYGLYYLIIP